MSYKTEAVFLSAMVNDCLFAQSSCRALYKPNLLDLDLDLASAHSKRSTNSVMRGLETCISHLYWLLAFSAVAGMNQGRADKAFMASHYMAGIRAKVNLALESSLQQTRSRAMWWIKLPPASNILGCSVD
jgi:hypothetical protein